LKNEDKLKETFPDSIFWYTNGKIAGVDDLTISEWLDKPYQGKHIGKKKLRKATKRITKVYREGGAFRESVIASIEAVLREYVMAANATKSEISEKIADRVFGYE